MVGAASGVGLVDVISEDPVERSCWDAAAVARNVEDMRKGEFD